MCVCVCVCVIIHKNQYYCYLVIQLKPYYGFWNSDRTVRSDKKNLELLLFTVLLASRTVQREKNRDPCEPQADLTVLRTVIRPLLTVPYFPLNLNLKKKKKKKKKKKEQQQQKNGSSPTKSYRALGQLNEPMPANGTWWPFRRRCGDTIGADFQNPPIYRNKIKGKMRKTFLVNY